MIVKGLWSVKVYSRPIRRLTLSSTAPQRTLATSPSFSTQVGKAVMAATTQNGSASTGPSKTSSRLEAPASRIAEAYAAGPDVWTVFNPVVFPTAVNLGQGFMSFPPPPFVRDALCKIAAERTDVHHYSHPKGRPRLRKAVADYLGSELKKPKGGKDVLPAAGQAPQIRTTSEELDVETEVLITGGANGGMYSVLTAFLEPG
jgi:kynurenine aminotransferase